MKKRNLILTLILPLLLAACSDQDEPAGGGREDRVIEFDEPFVNHVARSAEANTPQFDSFSLFGFVVRPDSYIYNGETVRRLTNNRWVCDRTEYWYPGKIYYFTGIAPVNSKGIKFTPATKGTATISGGGTISYDVGASDAKEDLLYAFSIYRTPSPLSSYIPPVEMEFNHLLSQITFTFYNELGNPHYFINCPNIMLGGIAREATIDLTNPKPTWQRNGWSAAWTGTEEPIVAIHTGQPQTSRPLYVLPVKADGAEITVYTQVFYTADPYATTGNPVTEINTIKVPFPDIDLKPGRSYNLICHLSHSNVEGDGGNLQPIMFTVEDGNWKYDYYIDVP